MKISILELIQAHQYLYYVLSTNIWTDYEYDSFCSYFGITGGGGSDLESSYSLKVKQIARYMKESPEEFSAKEMTEFYNHPPS